MTKNSLLYSTKQLVVWEEYRVVLFHFLGLGSEKAFKKTVVPGVVTGIDLIVSDKRVA